MESQPIQVIEDPLAGELKVPEALILTPSLKNPSAPSKAYISATGRLRVVEGECPQLGSPGTLIIVSDLTAIPNSPVVFLSHATPVYDDMAASPMPGDGRIFAVYQCGLDIIDSANDTIQELAITGFGGQHVRAGEVAPDTFHLFTLDQTSGTLTSYDLGTQTIAGQVTLPTPQGMDLSPDGRTLVVVHEGHRLSVLDAATLQTSRTFEVGPFATGPVAITADGTTALVPSAGQFAYELQYVRIAKRAATQEVDNLDTVIETVPDSAFIASPELSRQRRNALLHKLAEVRLLVEQIAAATDPEVKNDLIRQAKNKVENDILKKMDGFFGGDAQNDWIRTQEAQALLVPLVRALLNGLDAQVTAAAGPPPIL